MAQADVTVQDKWPQQHGQVVVDAWAVEFQVRHLLEGQADSNE